VRPQILYEDGETLFYTVELMKEMLEAGYIRKHVQ
jgi:hypothetical protein